MEGDDSLFGGGDNDDNDRDPPITEGDKKRAQRAKKQPNKK